MLPNSLMDEKVNELIRPNQSPYFAMYTLGRMNVPIEVISKRAYDVGVCLREKDVENWKRGYFNKQMEDPMRVVSLSSMDCYRRPHIEDMELCSFPEWPSEWVSTSYRFFPCSTDNIPLMKWGWSASHFPKLYDMASAKALSPCGWVGQNMIGQRFIVIDIDGVGHGVIDRETIAWGLQWKDRTLCFEDPAKPGSFHLYFSTDRILPIKHFPWAKIDLLGNSKNAAVYLKNKVPNKLPMMQLDEQVWNSLMDYQAKRKEL